MLQLEFPNQSHKEMYNELCDEIKKYTEEFVHPDNIYAFRWEKYSILLKNVRWDKNGTREWRVPSTAFFWVDDTKIIWAIQLRHHIDHPNLIFRGGHIGYGVRPSERRKWYASKMLFLILDKARELWLKKILITCDVENIASNKVILKNGGVLEKECLHEDGVRFNRYWINL